MRRAPAWVVVVGVVVAWAGQPAPARADGFWVSLATGAAGGANPSDYSEFWFESPHGPPVAIRPVPGEGTVQVGTAGGNTFFNTDADPVLVPTSDGYATVTNPGVANGSGGLPRFAGGSQASGPPQTTRDPGAANVLSGALGEPGANGSRVLTVGVADKDGNSLGGGQVTVPDGGWWVIGIGPGAPDTDPEPEPEPNPNPGGGGGGGGGPVTTPEPATVVLLGLGGVAAAGWRRLRRK